ncbi:TetR/AcrR family transcriptional regulator [Kitasatospora sp. NPDC096147]|uniref:TetR/AcrR family transcriptional regulator n=1 Tax=Kitasatospora sp. NPDC096147 TaxID=3364093 RepID=UPI0037FCE541
MSGSRREVLGDAAIRVLAEAGGRGLTHRAVDAAAGLPLGTAKNYHPSRDALLRAVAERIVEQYERTTAELMVSGARPVDRASLAALLTGLLRNVAGPGAPRMLAYLELQAEAARRPWLADILAPVVAADFTGFEHAQRAAGLPVTPRRAATVTLALHAAIPQLLGGSPSAVRSAGLDDLDAFVHGLLESVYGP